MRWSVRHPRSGPPPADGAYSAIARLRHRSYQLLRQVGVVDVVTTDGDAHRSVSHPTNPRATVVTARGDGQLHCERREPVQIIKLTFVTAGRPSANDPDASCQLCVVELRRTTPAPMTQDSKSRLVLCIVSAYPETA